MQNYKHILAWLIIGLAFASCEIPEKPDFKTSHKIEAPIMYNKTFQFMGQGSNVLIDTTSADMDSLFSVDGENFITISKEQDFDFGDLNDAIPEVNVAPTSFSATVGEIELGSFSSGGDTLGSASFEDLTGSSSAAFPPGTFIPGSMGQTTPHNIDIGSNADYFVSATIKSGDLEITVNNDLGIDIDVIYLDLKSGSTLVSSTTINGVAHNTTASGVLNFNNGDVLQDINLDVSLEWSDQFTQEEPNALIVESAEGVDLVASQVEAAVESQSFAMVNVTNFDNSEFIFDTPNHYVELESGELGIDEIINSIDITVEQMVISFPGIRSAPFNAADSLEIVYSGSTEITRNGGAPARQVDLTGFRIYAENNQIEYNIVATTENTQSGAGSETRVISETDQVSSSVSINNMVVKEAFGKIVPQTILLSTDDPNNGIDELDLYNGNEVELTEIDGLSDLSKQLEGLEFTQPTLSINYITSLGVPAMVYGAILGVNGKGEAIYLTGDAGSEFEVTTQIDGLNANGVSLNNAQLIKFEINPAANNGAVIFDENGTNVNEFLNNLPSEIRFIGKAVVNEDNIEGSVTTPIELSPQISVNLPLAFRTIQAATFTDTTDQDLEDMPSPEKGDKRTIKEGRLIIEYENGLPMEVRLNIAFLDSLKNEFDSIPLSGESITLLASGIDSNSRFATNPTSGSLQIALTESQLRQLYRTKYLEISAELLTTDENGDGTGDEVKVRTTDSITLSVNAEFTIESEVN
ncbi:MAG: hypothetical protein HUJ22_05340 [Gracilimonas sp.]|uniref:hypothetical protein n=1 Tax=Gracilimonas sp. TaxID=1974203 RepID=UPI0019C64E69|nr:hypothetical protein [Gracilimonas sp.]MBD3615978.1 hypothetical protein [Gracilimonas sp.]